MISLQANDFELFDVPAQYAQDRAQLDARWKALQREAHPDRFAAEGAAAQRVAMQWSVRINEAYQRLKDPLKRAAYLCELQGAPVQAENNTAMPAAFLMQQMEWREAFDDARHGNDMKAMMLLEKEVQAGLKAQTANAGNAISKGDFQTAAQEIRACLFLEKFLADIAVFDE